MCLKSLYNITKRKERKKVKLEKYYNNLLRKFHFFSI